MPIICDTHALLFWADAPQRLGAKAQQTMEAAAERGELACCTISLWEVAMLQAKGRITIGSCSTAEYLDDIVCALNLQVLPITPRIAQRTQGADFAHSDPADRIIAATALEWRAPLITADEKLHQLPGLHCIW